MIKTELKPCPFCGEAGISKNYGDWPDCQKQIDYHWGAGCETVDCHGEIDSESAYHRTEDEAIEAWNKRA